MIIHDHRLPPAYRDALRKKFPEEELVGFKPEGAVYQAINGHPDIYCTSIAPGRLVVAPSVKGFFETLGATSRLEIVKGAAEPRSPYPHTAPYNAVRCGNTFLHKIAITDRVVLEEAEKMGLEKVDVPQGYSRCSSVPVGRRGLLTSDVSIARAARAAGMDVMFIDPVSIELPMKANGLIGGASGIMVSGDVFFCGDILAHPDGERVLAFLKGHGVSVSWLEGLPLFDAGTVLFV